jgi:NAD-dependent dihydropyrimidine dehydrogenase PreA subunit/flavodoxin
MLVSAVLLPGEKGDMKRAVIYVFTGTGNTRIAAGLIKEALSARGVETAIWEARAPFDRVPDPNDYDIAGFGYPVHAFNTPRFFLRFVRSLPEGRGMPAFLFKTSGEPFRFNDASSRPLVRLLRKKGYVPMLDRHLLMPYNIVFRYKDALAKQMLLHTADMAEVLAEKLVGGPPQELRYRPSTVLLMYLFRLQWFGAFVNGPLIRANKQRCSGCGLCAKTCPADNIRMRGGLPRFGGRCAMCMRCAFYCPEDAVRPGILNPWRVNGPYRFERLVADDSVPATYINEDTKGYFRLFRPYYRETDKEISALKTVQKYQSDNIWKNSSS